MDSLGGMQLPELSFLFGGIAAVVIAILAAIVAAVIAGARGEKLTASAFAIGAVLVIAVPAGPLFVATRFGATFGAETMIPWFLAAAGAAAIPLSATIVLAAIGTIRAPAR